MGKNEWLTRTECSAMRGIAIMAIMLHNYCHWVKDIVRENEYTWTAAKCDKLWHLIQKPDEFFPVHLFSFFGHYGVPVFLFLSGFGLVMKYESSQSVRHSTSEEVSVWRFVRYNYLKLFRILIVGFVAFVMLDAITPSMHRYEWLDVVAMLGMFSNLLEHPSQTIWPGPYWYFGVTLQLYIIYRLLLYRWRHWGVVIAMIVLCWLLQEIYLDDQEMLERLRYNFMGGMLPFGMGVLLARSDFHPSIGWRMAGGLTMVCVALIVVMSFYQQTWLWVPVLIVIGTIALVKYLPELVLKWLVWLGGISAAIFVSHPIVRKIFIRPYLSEDIYAGLLLYVVASLVVAWLMMMVINKIPKPKL